MNNTVDFETALKAFHITTAIHDSRTSQRMIDYKVRLLRFGGTKPLPEVYLMTSAQEEIIAHCISDLIMEMNLQITAFNICRDHLHILLVCRYEDVPRIMHRIKGRTARMCNKCADLEEMLAGEAKPANEATPANAAINRRVRTVRKDGSLPFWTQKYQCKPILSADHYFNTVNYIRSNRIKHRLPPNDLLDTIIAKAVSRDHVF